MGIRHLQREKTIRRILEGLKDLALIETVEQSIAFGVLEKAIKDLSRGSPAARYFFKKNLHAPWCVVVNLDPRGVLRIVIAAQLLGD